ncbi:MAG: cysteate synthase [Rikenellaceae bacterium]|jgi:cysteate synthase|nr:cysteate synthase [Rikenellaceae bacterium]
MKDFKPTEYTLECVATGRRFEDAGWMLEDRMCSVPSLVRTVYAKKQLEVKGDDWGLYKFHDWLPIHHPLKGSAAPVTYKSTGLAKKLGLENLYITFSGWNPRRGARMTTCSFKETEAYSVCARIPRDEERILVVASAGNTARAFAKVCSDNGIRLLLSVPADNLGALWFEQPLNDCVKLIASEKGSDYFDAIHLSNLALKSKRFFAEGGAKNVARRDGMATTMLSAVTTIDAIPDYYFQAVGSGTGAIAAWEANLRFIEDGRFGSNKCRLMVSQNAPFVPIYDAWRVSSRIMLPYEDARARRDAEIIDAKVLSNRKPPYGLAGGLYDALKDTDGDVLVVTNTQLRKAAALFLETEDVDIHPAAAVATASLIKAVGEGRVERDKIVMLNITGGGEQLFKAGKELHYLQPSHVFSTEATPEEVLEKVETLFL